MRLALKSLLLLSLLTLASDVGRASEPIDSNFDGPSSFPPERAQPLQAVGKWADETHRSVSDTILRRARWLDSFFDDDRYSSEENRTRARLRLYGLIREGGENQYKLRLNFRLSLPKTENRLMLVFSGDDDGIGYSNTGNDFGDIDGTDSRETYLSLQYFFKSVGERNVRATLGFRFRDDNPVVVPGLRWRETVALGNWAMRFAQHFRWYSDEGWESRSTLDFDRTFAENWLLRATLEGFWSEEEQQREKGYSHDLNVSLVQPLSNRRAVAYELNNAFRSRPSHRLESSVVAVRYRQRIWRQWLFVEVAPQVAFLHEDDYDWKPGFEIQFEALFGHLPPGESAAKK